MTALILIDLQHDFLPGGALAVSDGDKILPIANRLLSRKGKVFDLVIATQDWHPNDHGSFASNNPGKSIGELGVLHGLDQVMWPDHCVQGTKGAEFPNELHVHHIDHVVRKGTDPKIDSYSGFFDNGRKKTTGLAEYLKQNSVTKVVLMGLATDYCVKFSVLDALSAGFSTTVVIDGCRAVNLQPGDDQRAFDEMSKAGARLLSSDQLIAQA